MENGDVLMDEKEITRRAQNVKMIIMDVDGTLTDGSLLLLPDGEEIKSYNVRDGMGILLAHLAGLKTGIITGKTSKALEHRAERLKIQELYQGILDKKSVLFEILEKHKLQAEDIAYIGDDLGDLEVIQIAGLAASVADAHPLIIENSHYHCRLEGGQGAVREFIEFIMTAQDKWEIIQEKIAHLKEDPARVKEITGT
jgi:3-deoxy-D-manno-octulosonate 8-phosphate phosphatase (KDO 8-P phosphatase)